MCLRSGSLISFWGFSDKGLLYLDLTLERRVESKSSPEGFFLFWGGVGEFLKGGGILQTRRCLFAREDSA